MEKASLRPALPELGLVALRLSAVPDVYDCENRYEAWLDCRGFHRRVIEEVGAISAHSLFIVNTFLRKENFLPLIKTKSRVLILSESKSMWSTAYVDAIMAMFNRSIATRYLNISVSNRVVFGHVVDQTTNALKDKVRIKKERNGDINMNDEGFHLTFSWPSLIVKIE